MKDIHIAICIPGRSWTAEFGMCLANLGIRLASQRLANAKSQRVTLINSKGSMLSQVREALFGNALRVGATHMFWCDTDMTFPPDACHRLFAHERAFVAAQGVTKQLPAQPVAQSFSGEIVYSTKPDKLGLEEVKQVGLAVALLDCEVVHRLRPPLFSMEWEPTVGAYAGEDVFFCHKFRKETGRKVFIDHELSREIGHMGSFEYHHGVVGEVVKAEVA